MNACRSRGDAPGDISEMKRVIHRVIEQAVAASGSALAGADALSAFGNAQAKADLEHGAGAGARGYSYSRFHQILVASGTDVSLNGADEYGDGHCSFLFLVLLFLLFCFSRFSVSVPSAVCSL